MSFCGVSELGRSSLTPVLVARRVSRRLDDHERQQEENRTLGVLTHGGFAMSFTLKFCLLRRSFLTRLLQTTGLSLALMMASAIGVHADIVMDIEVGATGALGFGDGFGDTGPTRNGLCGGQSDRQVASEAARLAHVLPDATPIFGVEPCEALLASPFRPRLGVRCGWSPFPKDSSHGQTTR
jgi:hypothetical protein